MKKLMLLTLSLALSTPAFAQQKPVATQRDWKGELAQFQQTLPTRSTGRLWLSFGYNGAKVIGACGGSAAITASVFVTDTLPLTNILAESIGNIVVPDYQTYETIWDINNLSDLGRGALGGGVVAVAETLEFVVLWLGGYEDQSWEALAKVYGSTIKTAETLFAHQGQCLMSASKLALVAKELRKRGEGTPTPGASVLPEDPTDLGPAPIVSPLPLP